MESLPEMAFYHGLPEDVENYIPYQIHRWQIEVTGHLKIAGLRCGWVRTLRRVPQTDLRNKHAGADLWSLTLILVTLCGTVRMT